MKIRLDFVTNSSSSSYIIDVYCEMENGLSRHVTGYYEYAGDVYDDSSPIEGESFRCDDAFESLIEEVNEGRYKHKGVVVKKIVYQESYSGNDENGNDHLYGIFDRIKEDLEDNADKENLEFYERFLKNEADNPTSIVRKCIYDVKTRKMEYSYSTEEGIEPHTSNNFKYNQKYFDDIDESDNLEIHKKYLKDEKKISIKDSDLDDIIAIKDDSEASFELRYHNNYSYLIPKLILEYKDWKRFNLDYISQSRLALYLMIIDKNPGDKIGPKAITMANKCYKEFMSNEHDSPLGKNITNLELFNNHVFRIKGFNNVYYYKYNLMTRNSLDNMFNTLDNLKIDIDPGVISFNLIKYSSYDELIKGLTDLGNSKIDTNGEIISNGITIKVSGYEKYGLSIDDLIKDYNINIEMDLINEGYALIHIYLNKVNPTLTLLGNIYVRINECDNLVESIKKYLKKNKFSFIDTPYMLLKPFEKITEVIKGSIDDYYGLKGVDSGIADINPEENLSVVSVPNEASYRYKRKD